MESLSLQVFKKYVDGLVEGVVLDKQLDPMILEVISNLNDLFSFGSH